VSDFDQGMSNMSQFPSQPIAHPDLQPIATAWSLSMERPWGGPWHEFPAGATESQLKDAEAKLGRSLPPAFRALYRFSDGMSLVDGNLNIRPLDTGDDMCLVAHSDFLRGCDWPIPDELVVFGDNGSDDLFGVWLPRDGAPEAPHPIICVGSIFEAGSFAVYGTDLPRFLRAWCGFYLLAFAEEPCPALDALGLPMNIREGERDSDEAFAACFAWADPGLPHIPPDPYEQRLSADDIRKMYPTS